MKINDPYLWKYKEKMTYLMFSFTRKTRAIFFNRVVAKTDYDKIKQNVEINPITLSFSMLENKIDFLDRNLQLLTNLLFRLTSCVEYAIIEQN